MNIKATKVEILEFETKKKVHETESISKAAKWLKIYNRNIVYSVHAGKPIEHNETKKKYIIKEIL